MKAVSQLIPTTITAMIPGSKTPAAPTAPTPTTVATSMYGETIEERVHFFNPQKLSTCQLIMHLPRLLIFYYCEVLGARKEKPVEKSKGFSETHAIVAIRADFVSKKIIYFDNLSLDFLFYFFLEHPFFGILFRHPCHPYSRWERISVQAFSLALSAVMMISTYDQSGDTAFQVASWIYGAVLSLLEIILKQIALCSCVQTRSTNVRKCCEGLSNLIVHSFGIGGICLLIFWMIFSGIFYPEATIAWVNSVLLSWFVFTPLLTIPNFLYSRCSELREKCEKCTFVVCAHEVRAVKQALDTYFDPNNYGKTPYVVTLPNREKYFESKIHNKFLNDATV